jgi:hypothetical protein
LFGGPGRDRLDAVDLVRRNDFLSGGTDRDRCVADLGGRLVSCRRMTSGDVGQEHPYRVMPAVRPTPVT